MTRKSSNIAIDRERFPVDTWRLVEIGLGADDGGRTGTLFATGNGYLGLRADWAPDPESTGTYVNGFHETFPIVHAEHAFGLARTGQSMLNAPEAKSIELMVGDEVLRMAPDDPERSKVLDFRREIDFRTGVLRSELIWHTRAAGKVRVVSERLVSLEHRHLAVLRLSIEPLDAPATVTIKSQLVNRQDVASRDVGPSKADPRRSRVFDRRVLEPVLQTHADADSPDGGTITLGYRCVGSGMMIAAAYRHSATGAGTVHRTTEVSGDCAATTMRLHADPGEPITLTKYVAYHSSSQVPEPRGDASIEELAARCGITLDAATTAGWEQSLAEQRAWLNRFWARTDIAVDGDDAVQQAIRWNLFQMAQASAQIGGRGIAAKAVTASGYDGHYFWDTEIYMVPLLAYTNPEAARDLLHFRHRTLPAARERAVEMSQRGALYPWRTLNGEEASAYYPAGTAQYHIDADIAYAIERYVTATGDTEFLYSEAAEMLVELARLFADLGFYDQADPPVFHIHGVTGPDEYTAVVDDNVYTNVMARFTLRFAADVVSRLRSENPDAHRALVRSTHLDDDEVADWTRAADAMCVLYDAELGINPQDDAFLGHEAWDWADTPEDKYPLLLNFHPLVIYRHQVLKQARRGPGDVPPRRRLRARRRTAQLRLLRPDQYGRFVVVRLRSGDHGCRGRPCRPGDALLPGVVVPRHRRHSRQHGRRRASRQRRWGVGMPRERIRRCSRLGDPHPHRAASSRGLAAHALSPTSTRRRHRDRGRSRRRHRHRRIGRARAHPRRRSDHRGRCGRIAAPSRRAHFVS